MSFDKIKAMRNAERFLSQGKIRAAISEYQRVVENDPKDFSTLNILGDLYVKNSEKKEAVGCFTRVAEHYNRQGFAQKAIAVYNKISRIEPNSLEISAKLAQLYQSKGSIAEARAHYTTIAEQYQRKGQTIEALAVWRQIAELDSNNTDVYLKIAEISRQENETAEAAKAFTDAGLRFNEQERFEEALTAFNNALEIDENYLRALNGLVKAQIGLGYTDEAAKILEGILEAQPYNRDILYLLIDCQLDVGNASEAEKAIIKLVEQEPANYPKFLDLIKIYLKNNDLDSASRILSMSSEHLLAGGQADELFSFINEILARNPEQIDALRLLIRYYGWQRDESELINTLERLAEVAQLLEAVDDERYALNQLVMLAPHEAAYAERLQEINDKYGFEVEEIESVDNLRAVPQYQFVSESEYEEQPEQNYNGNGSYKEFDFSAAENSFLYETDNSANDTKEFDFLGGDADVESETEFTEETANADYETNSAEEPDFKNEIESLEFYIAQGYKDLASKNLDELEEKFGKREEFDQLRRQIDEFVPPVSTEFEFKVSEVTEEPANEQKKSNNFELFDELKDEFDIEESAPTEEGDYETHYQMAVAYQEMGLMEDSIREFQDAVNLVKPNDGTRRFFKCANLLGHCFMEKQMPNLALMWYKRALETPDLTGDERQALVFELGIAYEAGGDQEKAIEYFEQVYAVDVDYRGVADRLQNLRQA